MTQKHVNYIYMYTHVHTHVYIYLCHFLGEETPVWLDVSNYFR